MTETRTSRGEGMVPEDGRERMVVDLHVHSEDSYDADSPVETILERAVDVGLDGIAVTDHDAIDESLRAAELAPAYGLTAVPGVEVSTADGHLLALGVEFVPERDRPLAETTATVRDAGGVAVIPHPFQRSRHGVRAADIGRPDAIEVYNAHTLTGFRNRQAARYAERHGLPGVGGSDAHAPQLVGRAATELRVDPTAPTAEAMLAAVRDGRTAARGRRTTTGQYLRKYVTNTRIRAVDGLGLTIR